VAASGVCKRWGDTGATGAKEQAPETAGCVRRGVGSGYGGNSSGSTGGGREWSINVTHNLRTHHVSLTWGTWTGVKIWDAEEEKRRGRGKRTVRYGVVQH